MSSRSAMVYRAVVNRQSSPTGVDSYGVANTLLDTYGTTAFSALACTWTAMPATRDGQDDTNDAQRELVTYRMLVPTGTDIRITDRVTSVVDGNGGTYWSGVADVVSTEVRRGHLRVTLLARRPNNG